MNGCTCEPSCEESPRYRGDRITEARRHMPECGSGLYDMISPKESAAPSVAERAKQQETNKNQYGQDQ